MTTEDKQLLLQDLCARLPYMDDLKVARYIERDGVIMDFIPKFTFNLDILNISMRNPEFIIKPYLRPMLSMTAEERKEYKDMNVLDNCDEFSNIEKNIEDIKKNGEENYIQLPRTYAQDYLNSIHVDYRGLIERGLALPAPEGMYNTNGN